MKKMSVVIYSTPNCQWCHKAKEFFKANKIVFQDIDVSLNQKSIDEMIKKSGQTGVPVIEIDSKIVLGFDKAAIKKALKLK